eukprot:TRINITY_DN30181_c0_g1_i1.p1 TRINITY_DN30181_c0_g1~~TRINITY_DN30181_c0_g1_i1.p1  ORF type:complete len:166 (+),score=9.13 TRINITY_DN30181_c0_g1_i1:55-552(+)
MGGARRGSPLSMTKSNSALTMSSASSGVFGEFGAYCQDTCSICLEKYNITNPAMTYLCGHAFHLQCAESWRERKGTCPLCWTTLHEAELYTGEPSPEKVTEVLLPPPPASRPTDCSRSQSSSSLHSFDQDDGDSDHEGLRHPSPESMLIEHFRRLVSRCCPRIRL